MRLFQLLCWGTLLVMPLAQAQMQASQVPVSECKLPELMLNWHRSPASLATASIRSTSDTAGQTEQPYRVTLQPCAADWCKPGSHAAMLKMAIPQAGRYRVAVDSMLWIDLYSNAQKLEGVLCEHSSCQPLRKIVQYDVLPGSHWVVLEGREAGDVGLLVSRVNQ
jgi:hypothetical protein